MVPDSILTSEEQAYLAELANEEPAHRQSSSPSFKIEGNWQATELLARLAANSRLSLEAETGRFCLSFQLQLVEDEFHSQHIELSAPTIYETGPKMRAWRLQLKRPLPLLEADGGKSALRVHELSPNGLLVGNLHNSPPEHFHLHLPLPDGEAMPISAHRVRETKSGLTAYEVEFSEEQDTERLRRFLFSQHRRLHPELESELPEDLV
ncbi:PilZ domain-containing protein [Stutzerimonas tarimensis]|uniref:PilZ domain-containing protein n=1 Tax=Stutzerimonas tarimensis TaxID=1507735 RepID=A0ABV7T142_9GAMM